jgi:hypothetical protein
MRSNIRMATVATLAAVVAAISALPASAACTRLGFSVNDYGKDGPTKDAKDLLDKHIATTMASRGITKYNTGKKDVKCELYLNLILFDEHTCRAEATVCWDGAPLPKGEVAGGEATKPKSATAATAPAKSLAPKTDAAKPAEAKKSSDASSATSSSAKPADAAKAPEASKSTEAAKAAEKTATPKTNP